MDGGAPTTKAGSGGKKAVLPVPAEMNDAGASAATTSARGARKATLPGAAACASTDVDAPAAATAAPGEESNGGGEEDDDEQVERGSTRSWTTSGPCGARTGPATALGLWTTASSTQVVAAGRG